MKLFSQILFISIVTVYSVDKWPQNITVGLITSINHPLIYAMICNKTVNDLKIAGVVPEAVYFK